MTAGVWQLVAIFLERVLSDSCVAIMTHGIPRMFREWTVIDPHRLIVIVYRNDFARCDDVQSLQVMRHRDRCLFSCFQLTFAIVQFLFRAVTMSSTHVIAACGLSRVSNTKSLLHAECVYVIHLNRPKVGAVNIF